ncbi:MAG: metallophosphoesterase family protein, partial [Victivallales bacterium]|nr:metallophosphoesterase family protein [Victivallales bacterium]
EWTQTQLTFDDIDWLAKLPESLASDEDFNLIHGSNTPNHYNYCRDEETIKLNFEYQQYPLCFCGHSHSPLIGVDRGAELPYVDYIRKQTIKPDAKVLVNVGSVGQPRDGDPRATIVYYEFEEHALAISRIPYNFKITQEKIRAANLPEKFAARLAVGK